MDNDRRPLERENLAFAFDLTPDVTGGRVSARHSRVPGAERGEASCHRVADIPHPGAAQREGQGVVPE